MESGWRDYSLLCTVLLPTLQLNDILHGPAGLQSRKQCVLIVCSNHEAVFINTRREGIQVTVYGPPQMPEAISSMWLIVTTCGKPTERDSEITKGYTKIFILTCVFGLIREQRSLGISLDRLSWWERFWADFVRTFHLSCPTKVLISLLLEWGVLRTDYPLPLPMSVWNRSFGGSWNLDLIWVSDPK